MLSLALMVCKDHGPHLGLEPGIIGYVLGHVDAREQLFNTETGMLSLASVS